MKYLGIDRHTGGWIGGSWSACAQACAEKNWEGRLPLHLAAEHGASVAVVGRLLQHHPHAAAAKGKNDQGRLPLELALEHKAPEGVLLAIIDAHPQVHRHAESRRTKEFSPLGPRAAVSWPWVLAWGSLEPSRRGGENAQRTGKKRGGNGRDMV